MAKHQDRDLQIGVHHERIAVLFEIAFRGAGDLEYRHFASSSLFHIGLLTLIKPRARKRSRNTKTGIMTSGVTGEECGSHGGNLEQNETGNEAQASARAGMCKFSGCRRSSLLM